MVVKPLKSFGCSFIYGTDLADDGPDFGFVGPRGSKLTYPALIADKLGLDYSCFAQGGQGNLSILFSILKAIATRMHQSQSPWIINWTYIDRFDYGFEYDQPICDSICPTDQTIEAQHYYKFFNTEYTDQIRTLQSMYCAIQALQSEQIPFLMTYMDPLITDQSWAQPGTKWLQQQIAPFLHSFEGMDFLTWSKSRGFPVSNLNHPLEEAHAAAADLMLPVVQDLVYNKKNRS